MRHARPFAFTALLALVAPPAAGCHVHPGAVAPSYGAKGGAAIGDDELPLAAAHYAFAKAGGPVRADIARPLADRLLVRAGELFAASREKTGLAAVRLAASIVRTNKVAPDALSDPAVRAIDAAVQGPAARGEEGAAIGLYMFWSMARPSDGRPKHHLQALTAWTSSPRDFPPSPLVNAAREATRRSDALAYAGTAADRAESDAALARWMDYIVAFKEGERVVARYGDEVYSAVTGFRTAGFRLVAGHLRDGDFRGASEAISNPQTQGFVPENLRHAILDGGTAPDEGAYQKIIAALLPGIRVETAEDVVSDAVLGTAIAGTADYPRSAVLAEVAARGLLSAGCGDAAPALLARALLGTREDPRNPAAKDLGRSLNITAAAIRDYADREDFSSARRTFDAGGPLLHAADHVDDVTPSSAMIKTLMAIVEGEGGRPAVARALYDEAIAAESIPSALAGKARLEARDGNLVSARNLAEKALATKAASEDDGLHAELLTIAGDLARRMGDAPAARRHYEAALNVLVPVRSHTKGAIAAEAGRRIALVLTRFADGTDKEDEAETQAESAAGSDAREIARVAFVRYLRALRGQNPKNARRAKGALRRITELGLSAEDNVRAAVLTRAIERRLGLAPDPDVLKVFQNVASHDDYAGRLARFALGTLDGATLITKAIGPRHALVARFVVAIARWGDGGVEAARTELTAVAHSEVVGALEADLALELLDPEHATIPGAVTAKNVPGI